MEKRQQDYFHQYLLREFESITEAIPEMGARLRDFGKLYRRQQVEFALQRLQKGTYGKCIACGVDIVYHRLNADPTTLCCARCE